eukprot:7353196-Prymnesium_polylepis.2
MREHTKVRERGTCVREPLTMTKDATAFAPAAPRLFSLRSSDWSLAKRGSTNPSCCASTAVELRHRVHVRAGRELLLRAQQPVNLLGQRRRQPAARAHGCQAHLFDHRRLVRPVEVLVPPLITLLAPIVSQPPPQRQVQPACAALDGSADGCLHEAPPRLIVRFREALLLHPLCEALRQLALNPADGVGVAVPDVRRLQPRQEEIVLRADPRLLEEAAKRAGRGCWPLVKRCAKRREKQHLP